MTKIILMYFVLMLVGCSSSITSEKEKLSLYNESWNDFLRKDYKSSCSKMTLVFDYVKKTDTTENIIEVEKDKNKRCAAAAHPQATEQALIMAEKSNDAYNNKDYSSACSFGKQATNSFIEMGYQEFIDKSISATNNYCYQAKKAIEDKKIAEETQRQQAVLDAKAKREAEIAAKKGSNVNNTVDAIKQINAIFGLMGELNRLDNTMHCDTSRVQYECANASNFEKCVEIKCGNQRGR